jgi:DHA1 family tetracycline resistance protein-like MFS transporter
VRWWRLPRALVPIYGTTFADTLGYTLMIPLLPTLVHRYHASVVMAGALISIPAACSAIAAPAWGKVSDRLGRKPIIIASQILSCAGYVLLAISHSLVWMLVARVVSGCGGGSLGAVESYIADVTRNEQREQAYSLYGAVFGLAFVIGPVASGALSHHGIALPFYFAAAFELANIAFTAMFLPIRTRSVSARTSVAASLRAAGELRVRRILVRHFLFILAVVAFLANFSLFVDKTLKISVEHAAYMLAAAGAVGGVVLVALVTPLSRRIGEFEISRIGLAIGALAYAVFAITVADWMLAVGLVIWAVGAAIVEPTLTALLSESAKEQERGAIMGMSDSINSVAMIVGPAAGAALVAANPHALGAFCALVAGCALVIPRASGDGRSRAPRPRRKTEAG